MGEMAEMKLKMPLKGPGAVLVEGRRLLKKSVSALTQPQGGLALYRLVQPNVRSGKQEVRSICVDRYLR